LVYHRLAWQEPFAPHLLQVLYEDEDMVCTQLEILAKLHETHSIQPSFSLDGLQGPSRDCFSSNFCKPRLLSIVMLVCYYC
jgi:hypothetical protein